MRVLVLGGTRFIGRAVVEHLLRDGHDVTLLNRGQSEDPFGTQIRRILGDRCEPETVRGAATKRDYDAVVIAAGFAGLGLGATPVAIANMNAVTEQYGPSTKAFLVVPLVGAFFIDLLNAGTINFFIQFIKDYLI